MSSNPQARLKVTCPDSGSTKVTITPPLAVHDMMSVAMSRNSRKSERDEGVGGGGKSDSKKGRVTRDGVYERPLIFQHI